jgi:predicted enzyme related to lactoylglutathione lyase
MRRRNVYNGRSWFPGFHSITRRAHLAINPSIAARPRVLLSLVISKIKFLGIPVADQDRALRFYTEKLGFTVVGDVPFDEKQRWITLTIPGAETNIILFTYPDQEDRIGTFVNMAFQDSDIQKTYEDLSAKGIEFVKPPTPQAWGSYALFKDSEGNTLCLATESNLNPNKD